jgi:homopolymeric O-antigen transport system ATP-binding protein
MSDIAIRSEKLGKRYRIGERQRYLALRDVLTQAVKAPLRLFRPSAPKSSSNDPRHIWALKDASFEVREGEVVGLIGRNGAGKSTLLKILARVTKPTEGFAKIHGRLGSLLEVGTGFHAELTGRENVYLSGAILGMKKREIVRKFDEIVAFAEVEKFIDTPLKHYSTGMQMRLAFAVAAHLEPEILLVDEVLAVGDSEFQKKCLGKMEDVSRGGRTILFVSHNMGAITRLCPRSLLLDSGKIALSGPSDEVVSEYQSRYLTTRAEWTRPRVDHETKEFRFLSVQLQSEDCQAVSGFAANESVDVETRYEVTRALSACQIGVRICMSDGTVVFTTSDADHAGVSALPKNPGCYRARFSIPGGFLRPGTYYLVLGAHMPNRCVYDFVGEAVVFEVSTVGSLTSLDGRLGIVAPLMQWETSVDQEAICG